MVYVPVVRRLFCTVTNDSRDELPKLEFRKFWTSKTLLPVLLVTLHVTDCQGKRPLPVTCVASTIISAQRLTRLEDFKLTTGIFAFDGAKRDTVWEAA